jgi:hypothetical protein
MYGNLRRAFESLGRGNTFAQMDVLLLSAALAHYISDAHVPLHGVSNYNGQLSGQIGVHNRWESTMFERYRTRLTIAPKPARPIATPRDFVFDRVLEDAQLVPALLKGDADAIGNRDVYDDAYYDAFFSAQRRVMEDRLDQSIAAVAGIIAGAWEAAGKPAVPVASTSPLERRRRQ